MAEASPVSFEVDYPQSLDPPKVLYKWIIAFPHYVVLYFYGLVAFIMAIVAFVRVVQSKKYPRAQHDFILGYLRWTSRAYAYALLMRDEYPPFSLDEPYPVRADVRYTEEDREVSTIFQWLLVIPNLIVLWIFSLLYLVSLVLAAIGIFQTNKYPENQWRFALAMHRWGLHATAYAYGLTSVYPPFGVGDMDIFGKPEGGAGSPGEGQEPRGE